MEWSGGRKTGCLDAKNFRDSRRKERRRLVLYCHFPVYPADPHNLWNAEEVVSLLEEFSCVKAYINGHNHKGKYGQKNGIHYLTLKGMVETESERLLDHWCLIRVSIKVTGYGREAERVLQIR
jgi:hypothetical protein